MLPDSVSQECKIFLMACPRPPNKSMLNVQVRPTLLNSTLNSAAACVYMIMLGMKDPTWNLSQPPTLMYSWISACMDVILDKAI